MSFQRGSSINNASVSSFSRPSYTAGVGQGFGNRKISQTKFGRENLNPGTYNEQNSYSPGRAVGRPTSRQPARDSRQYYGRPNQSRMSSASDQSHNLAAMLNDGQIFPQDLLFLLSEQERNITSFKDRIEKEKMKLENDFTNFKNQIEHIIEDLKISLQAELDNVYRFFIEKYANLKSEVQEVRHIRKEIEAQNRGNDFGAFINASSNKELVKELERDAEHYKIYRMQNYITEMQKKKLNPLLDLSKEIILLGTSSNSYYNSDSTLKQLTELKSNFGHFTKHMFGALGEYVISPQFIIEDNMMADDLRSDAGQGQLDEDFQVPTRNPKKEFYEPGPQPYGDRFQDDGGRMKHANASVPVFRTSHANERPNERFDKQQRPERQPQRFIDRPPMQRPADRFDRPQRQNNERPPVTKKQFTISQSQQIVTSNWVQDLSLKPLATIRPDHADIVLCAIMVNGKYVVTGGKDSNLNVYTVDGAKVITLKGHQASICSLAIINDPVQGALLASGSDHGCSSLVVWTTNNWTMRMKIQAHTAAVTSIVDLCDGQTIVTGSYDKKINIYSYRKDAVLYNLPNNRASVTGIILNSSRNKMISCGLDNCLYIWNITRRQDGNGTVESITLDKTIQNNTMICSLNSSQLRSDVIVAGTKDGKIKFWNLSTGELQKTWTANNSAIIELVVIERESKPNFPIILSCSSRDKALVMTRTDSGLSSLFEVNDKLNIEFGCGIGPKIVFDNSRWSLVMCLVSQVAERKEINLFEVELK